ncbi:MAG: deoxyribonuclease IV [Candidatus Magasanikbacteria bacterium]|nr:deoxyribonuclease IV [Candidatus Magasanikbacteria bacterium]
MYFGAHVSIAGGLVNAPLNAAKIGCEVFQIFTRSPQGGWTPELNAKIATDFKAACKTAKQKEWYVHTPYFINFASSNPRIKHASISIVRQELERASMLGAKFLMTHLGSYASLGKEKGFVQLIAALDATLKGYKGKTKFLIEISAGAGDIIGGTFEDMAKIVLHPTLKKYDIGVCFDTQHAFASGYDIRDKSLVDKTLAHFDKTIGLKRLKMSHCNDSKTEFNSHSDHHAHIGKGKIGNDGFAALISDKRLAKINFILETKPDMVEDDLVLLKKLRDNK